MKSGNVGGGTEKAQVVESFQEGDVVGLTAAAIRRREFSNMTPRLLYEIGQPNEFLVVHAFETEKDGPCISLLPCCTVFLDRERGGKKRCTGHPAALFEKKDFKRMAKKGDKSSSIHLPFMLLPLLGINWEEDEQNPSFKFHALGKELLKVDGPIAKLLKNLAEENNAL